MSKELKIWKLVRGLFGWYNYGHINTELIEAIDKYLRNNILYINYYITAGNIARGMKIKYHEDNDNAELWIINSTCKFKYDVYSKVKYSVGNLKEILISTGNFRLTDENNRVFTDEELYNIMAELGYDLVIVDSKELNSEKSQVTEEVEVETEEVEVETEEVETTEEEVETTEEEVEDTVNNNIVKEEYNPSYQSSEQLKELFNCQDKKLKPNVVVKSKSDIELENQMNEQMKPLKLAVEANEKLSGTVKKEFKGCEKCNYTTYIDMGGIKVQCDCVAKNCVETDKHNEVNRKPEVKIKDVDIMNNVIPLERRNDEFNSESSKAIVTEMLRSQGFKVYGYYEYLQTMNTILASIATDGLKNSYIIGAPNGFGKTTFVYTAIKRLIAKGKKVVPFMSLTELAEIRVAYKEKLLKKLRNDKYLGNNSNNDEFTWKDYVDSDILFTCLSSAESKEVESLMLYDLLKIRGKNNKPTVVMMSQSLQWYTSDSKLNERYWSDILSYKGDSTNNVGLDRLIHVSCYKRAIVQIGAKKGVDY